jgi:natural product biosynthesis luciferase-like monooxygenase protein
MDFGIMFFSSADRSAGAGKYGLLCDAARFADAHGFSAVWTPERHFHQFGGLFPNPALTSAALATITSRLQLRAGSVISLLHNTLRLAEDWAVVDNLSNGRVALSFGSGWNADDFVLAPDRYERRQALMYEQIAAIQALWRGEPVTLPNGAGREVAVRLFPQPVQRELPLWVTSSGNAQTFASAGAIGANLLTHLLGQDIPALTEKIGVYREARAAAGHDPSTGIVTLMLHTCIGADDDTVRAKVRQPFSEYLRSAVTLEQRSAASGGAISGGHRVEAHEISESHLQDLVAVAFDRYYRTASLMGTPDTCLQTVWTLADAGVDEIACLIDFGLGDADIMDSLEYVDAVRASCSKASIERHAAELAAAFVERQD